MVIRVVELFDNNMLLLKVVVVPKCVENLLSKSNKVVTEDKFEFIEKKIPEATIIFNGI